MCVSSCVSWREGDNRDPTVYALCEHQIVRISVSSCGDVEIFSFMSYTEGGYKQQRDNEMF